MELSQLIYFRAVATYQTVTDTARRLNLTQSAVSKAITALEAELGTQLFVRSNRRMTLTRDGESFLLHVQRALDELDWGRQELLEHRTQRNEISIRVLTPEFLLGIIETFMQAHPSVRLTQNYQSSDTEKALLSGEISFCISSTPFANHAITWKPLLTDPIYLLVSARHPLANAGAVQLSRFSEDNFITFNSNMDLANATQRFCRLAGFTPNIAYETGETPDMLKLVDMGFGVAFCSSCIRLRPFQDNPHHQETSAPYRYLKITYPQCTRTIGLSYVKGRYLSPESREFVQFVENYFVRLDQQIRRWLP